jgi:antitoxin PrlF
MATDIATVTSKGQITVPVRMREKLGLRPGSKVAFEEQPNGDYVVRKKTGDIRELRGLLKAPAGVSLTIEDMNRAIGEAMKEKLARSR